MTSKPQNESAADESSTSTTGLHPPYEDFGEPVMLIYQAFDNSAARTLTPTEDSPNQAPYEGATWTVGQDSDQRYRLRIVAARESGEVRDLWIQRIPNPPEGGPIETVVHLAAEAANRLIDLLGNKAFVSLTTRPSGEKVEHQGATKFDLSGLAAAYENDPELVRELIASDVTARDVLATAHRRSVVEEFRQLLSEPAYFEIRKSAAGGNEAVWQKFFESNPWVLGGSLATHFFTSWDSARLEQIVVGRSIAGVGKRVDGLLRTAGLVRSMVFVEIKHHRTELLKDDYRAGCWRISDELAGAVAQSQGTVQLAVEGIQGRLQDRDDSGADLPGDFTYAYRPRSYVVAGSLGEFVSKGGGDNQAKIRSFELFRRNLVEPEVLTFDEVLARAELLVEVNE